MVSIPKPDFHHGLLELHSPRPQDERVSDLAQARRRKEAIRNELRPRVQQQFSDANVRKFIRRMERPLASSRWKSIRTLIADGAELQGRLCAARQLPADDPARAETLRCAVRPYLQLVDVNLRDDFTGIPLRDIWRYFRYTWSIPQTPVRRQTNPDHCGCVARETSCRCATWCGVL